MVCHIANKLFICAFIDSCFVYLSIYVYGGTDGCCLIFRIHYSTYYLCCTRNSVCAVAVAVQRYGILADALLTCSNLYPCTNMEFIYMKSGKNRWMNDIFRTVQTIDRIMVAAHTENSTLAKPEGKKKSCKRSKGTKWNEWIEEEEDGGGGVGVGDAKRIKHLTKNH